MSGALATVLGMLAGAVIGLGAVWAHGAYLLRQARKHTAGGTS